MAKERKLEAGRVTLAAITIEPMPHRRALPA
jgi:hypothetical protein